MIPYRHEIEQTMTKFYKTLNEKDRRRYAAMEAMKLGHGGRKYIAKLFDCCRDTISSAIDELSSLPDDCRYAPEIRDPGGGRKPYDQVISNIDTAFVDVISNHTAGAPTDDGIRWTNLTHQQIADLLMTHHSIRVSKTVVAKLLKKHHFKRRKAQKKAR